MRWVDELQLYSTVLRDDGTLHVCLLERKISANERLDAED
jgi:hypothetical protein